ncbi:MAG TPA: 6-phospho-beta-glucosidase [Anaerolineae bacterium]|nr:6-phospho-beta-glucosidase [Anaerolineae bacterium]
MEKPRIEKLAYIGGGSSYTPEFVDGFIQHEKEVEVEEIALHDIDEARLKVVGGMVERMLRYAELDTRVTLTTTRPEAIEGAEFIVSAIRVGGMEARIRDEMIPLKYDVVGQETTGPGGTLKAWRTIPVALEIARDLEKYARDAWYLNFTNPSGIITEAIFKNTDLKVVGLCNNPINVQMGLAIFFDVTPEEVFLEWVGLNHVNWIQRIFVRGVDRTEELIDRIEQMPFLNEHDPSLVKALGVIPTGYLRYYYYHTKMVEELKGVEKTRGEVVRQVEKDLMEKYADPNQLVKPPELSLRGGALYSEAAMRLILSLMFDRRDIQIVVTRNNGTIPDLPEDASVEVPCVVGAHGVTPLHMGPLPDTIRALCQQAKAWESWTVEAGVTGDRDAALMAMLTNPLVPSFEIAKALLDEMLPANKEFLPQFFPQGA